MVDVNTEYQKMFDAKNRAFQAAKSAGDTEQARKIALDLSSILEKMAKNSPIERKMFMEAAGKWRSIGEGSVPVIKKKIMPETGNNSGAETEEDFISQVESMITKSAVRWDDIGGLHRVKSLLKETVVIAAINKPASIVPWKGILFFGPPGTGKTMLAAAAAGSLQATFYNVTSDKLLSKYFGESSKLITALYGSAMQRAPSFVFIDELDALVQSRDSDSNDASRKVLNTLLQEMDGLKNKKNTDLLLTIGATNRPWDMDEAVLSRFPRRIYIDLPDAYACSAIVKIHTAGLDTAKLDIDSIGKVCAGKEKHYAGRDIEALCQAAKWNMIHDVNPRLDSLADLSYSELRKRTLKTRPLEMDDFDAAFKKVRSPTTLETLERYRKWEEQYGERA